MNWIKRPAAEPSVFVLDGHAVDGITPELRPPGQSTGAVAKLSANKARCFEGPLPSGAGFLLPQEEAEALLRRTDAAYREVVRPYLTGEDLADDPKQAPRRWIIDFAQMPLEAAMRYPAALDIVRERVKPVREHNNRDAYRQYWWRFAEPRPGMRRATSELPRYIGGLAFGKRLLMAWQDRWTCPSGKIYVYAFDDDYSMGIMSSLAHGAWAWSRGATLKADLSYTASSVFETFPWPFPVTEKQRERVAEASRAVIGRRQEICAKNGFGLTALYNLVEEGAYTDLKALHHELDQAVAAAYGWPSAEAHVGDALVGRLLKLNREIVAGNRGYEPFEAGADGQLRLPEE